jgi:hypothetical protein
VVLPSLVCSADGAACSTGPEEDDELRDDGVVEVDSVTVFLSWLPGT